MRHNSLFHLAISIFFVLLVGCGGSGSCGRYDDCDYSAYEEEFIEADASDVDAQEVESSGFDNCTDDCSGHEAGFEWAKGNDVTGSSECGGDSQSFVEGCESFAEERQALADDAAQENHDDERYDNEDGY